MSIKKTFAAICTLVALSPLASFALGNAVELESKWRDLGEENHLGGDARTEADLDGMVVVVVRTEFQKLTSVPFTEVKKIFNKMENERCTLIYSVTGEKNELKNYVETSKKLKLPWKTLSAYNDFGLVKDEPKFDSTPFAYVLNHKGETLYVGNDFQKLKGFVGKGLKAMPPEDPIFSLTPPKHESLLSVTNMVGQGKTLMPAYAFLRKMSANKDPEIAKEALTLIASMDQMCSLRLTRLKKALTEKPGRVALEIASLGKMWPKSKSDERSQYITLKLKQLEETSKLMKLEMEVDSLAAFEPQKPAQKRAALARAKAGELKAKKLQSAKAQSAKTEAYHLEAAFASLVSKFGGE